MSRDRIPCPAPTHQAQYCTHCGGQDFIDVDVWGLITACGENHDKLKRCLSNFQTLEAENASLRAQLAEVMAERDDLRRQLQEANIAEAELVMENDALTFSIHDHTARLAVADRELRRWRGCPSCKQDHDSSTDCPPHEARIKGRAWFHTQARDWEERAVKAEEQLAEMTVAKDQLKQAEDERDRWENIATQAYDDGVLQHLRLAELVAERDEALARAEAAEKELKIRTTHTNAALKGAAAWGSTVVATITAERDQWKAIAAQERDAALTRAEAAESAAGVMREALEVILIGTRKNRHNCSNCNSTFVEAEDALAHPEAQDERVQKLKAVVPAARELLYLVDNIDEIFGFGQPATGIANKLREVLAALAALDATGKEEA